MKKPTYYIRYDCELKKVGCVLLQVIGGTVPKELFFKHFGDSNSWLLHPTPNLHLYPITEDQLPILASKTDFTPRRP
jgi:hypothetical protein